MVFGMRLGGFSRVMLSVAMMSMRTVRVVRRLLVVVFVIVLCGFAMVARGVFVVLGGPFVMFRGMLRHVTSLH
jgi:hypothetical protein